jgi:hypothetical protein
MEILGNASWPSSRLKSEKALMTTRYEQLAALAIADSKALFRERQGCTECAAMTRRRIAEHLEIPAEDILFLKLDKELRPTTDASPAPELTLAPDLSWHFAIKIRFGNEGFVNYAAVILYMSVWPDANAYTLEHDREFAVDPKNEHSFSALADHVFNTIRDDYTKPRRSRNPKIGFSADI